MKKIRFNNPQFIKTAVSSHGYPNLRDRSGREMVEIAISGRSNVGKSSLINHLFRHRKMAKTSSTPGKTQAINFFTVDDAYAFVDLPGYGYAKVSKKMRWDWGSLMESYLENRPSLKMLLFLFDIRRIPSEEDRMLMDWIAHYGFGVILVLTKVDKVSKNVRSTNTKKILEAFECGNLHYVHYSVTKNIGRQELISMLNEGLQGGDDGED